MATQDRECMVFVGGISWKASEADLFQLFSSFGQVTDCKIIMDRATGKSKGFGFVTFSDKASAEKVKAMQFVELLGKSMNVGDAVRSSTGGSGSGSASVPRPAPSAPATAAPTAMAAAPQYPAAYAGYAGYGYQQPYGYAGYGYQQQAYPQAYGAPDQTTQIYQYTYQPSQYPYNYQQPGQAAPTPTPKDTKQ